MEDFEVEEQTPEVIPDNRPPFESMVNTMFTIEKLRVAAQIRQSHLALQNRQDPETDALLAKLQDLEGYVDGRIATMVMAHPAYPWFSRVKGIGKENIGKVVGLIDITRAPTISALWKFAGYAPVDGHAEKRVAGEKAAFNGRLRTMCWRVGGSLMKVDGKFRAYYDVEKEKLRNRYTSVIPAAKLPKKDGKKYEPEGVISEGHLHNMALRKMIKLFLACLWLEWRQAVGLPIREPYAIGQMGHTAMILPAAMTDRETKKVRAKAYK